MLKIEKTISCSLYFMKLTIRNLKTALATQFLKMKAEFSQYCFDNF